MVISCTLTACVQKKGKAGKDDLTERTEQKDSTAVDFIASGFEDLGTSPNMKDIICQNWDFFEDARDAKYAEPSTNLEFVYRGYSLFSDGTLIKDPRGNMRFGKWSINDQVKPITLSFLLDKGETETYQLAYLAPYEMKLAKAGVDKKDIIDLRGEALRYKDIKNDPFYSSNNLWRLKPAKPETDDQIKARLKSCIHFFAMFYEHKIKAHAGEVIFIGLPSCFRWYSGAIYLQKKDALDYKWVNSFYDKEQAMKAYKFADKLMDTRFKWPKNEPNWLKMNLAVLRQMEAKLDTVSL
ncbi:hypothetical protein BH11BAC4_BH11BAC4_09070 [soil metagenome]